MLQAVQLATLKARIESFRAEKYYVPRLLALYAAAIATADSDLMETALRKGKEQSLERHLFNEIVLQSYLFLGFPRMLMAAETLDSVLPAEKRRASLEMVSEKEAKHWYVNGLQLCKKVYGENFEALKTRVEAISPEIFRWMIIEGYGKVLSRPGLGVVDRELANVGMLLIDDREQQLHSHMKGALNVGATPDLLVHVVEDIGPAAGNGYETARQILGRLKVS